MHEPSWWNDVISSAGKVLVPIGLNALNKVAKGIDATQRYFGAESGIIPVEHRAYLENTTSPELRNQPITQGFFYPDELNKLQQLVMKIHPGNVKEGDYSEKEGGYQFRKQDYPEDDPLAQSLYKTLGKFSYNINPDKSIVITDVYDFNVPKTVQSGLETYGENITKNLSKGNVLGAATTLGSKYIPTGQGRKVIIRLNPPTK